MMTIYVVGCIVIALMLLMFTLIFDCSTMPWWTIGVIGILVLLSWLPLIAAILFHFLCCKESSYEEEDEPPAEKKVREFKGGSYVNDPIRAEALKWWNMLSMPSKILLIDEWQRDPKNTHAGKKWSYDLIDKSTSTITVIYERIKNKRA